jgi:MSHA pilin protein MshC
MWSIQVNQKGYSVSIQNGFTMIELITVIVITGILSATVAPRFFDRITFDSRGFYDQTISTLRYAQKTAIAQRRLVCVAFPTSSKVVLTISSVYPAVACNTNLQNPGGTSPYTIIAPSGVTLSGFANFNFNALGQTTTAVGPINIGSYTITLDRETGYVR